MISRGASSKRPGNHSPRPGRSLPHGEPALRVDGEVERASRQRRRVVQPLSSRAVKLRLDMREKGRQREGGRHGARHRSAANAHTALCFHAGEKESQQDKIAGNWSTVDIWHEAKMRIKNGRVQVSGVGKA